MGALINLTIAVGGFFYTLPIRANLYDKRSELRQQGGVVCLKANMCSDPIRRATLSLASSACFIKEYKAPKNWSTTRDRLGRRFYGR